ncbi:MAG: hypothetical protein Kow0074_08670 [Candidatus Zixiibacteriota bacterium]
MRLRFKVLSGFIVLALMLSMAGAWSIGELNKISTAVQDLLSDNYKSIDASKTMLEALEREDSGILFLMLGRWEEGRDILKEADAHFQSGFETASNNLTIPGEDAYVSVIQSRYAEYKSIWERPIVDTPREGDLNWYFGSVHPSFLSVKSAVNDLMTLNDRTMFETASSLRQQANRALMPGIVAIIAALVFSLMFSYFVNIFVVNPIVRITNNVRRTVEKRVRFDVQPETKDELADLADSIRMLVNRSDLSGPPQGTRR